MCSLLTSTENLWYACLRPPLAGGGKGGRVLKSWFRCAKGSLEFGEPGMLKYRSAAQTPGLYLWELGRVLRIPNTQGLPHMFGKPKLCEAEYPPKKKLGRPLGILLRSHRKSKQVPKRGAMRVDLASWCLSVWLKKGQGETEDSQGNSAILTQGFSRFKVIRAPFQLEGGSVFCLYIVYGFNSVLSS